MRLFYVLPLVLVLAACGSLGGRSSAPETIAQRPASFSGRGNDVAFYALSLIDTGYRFGGKNPQAGLDCSGMVTYIFDQAVGLKVSGSAADIARSGRPVARQGLKPGDLVFFNTMNRPYSHMGVYLGDGKFIHAPRTNSTVRVDSLDNRYFASRFDGGRTVFR